MTSYWLTSANLTSVQQTSARLTTEQLTNNLYKTIDLEGSRKIKPAVNLTETWITTSQLTNNLYKSIDLRDIPVRCSGISCKKFLNPEGEFVYSPCTSLCFACPDEMFAPRTIKPLPDWTY